MCGYGGIGRHARFRILWETVQVQVLLPAPYKTGCGAVGSALDWGSRGRKFKSCHSDQKGYFSVALVLYLKVQKTAILGGFSYFYMLLFVFY